MDIERMQADVRRIYRGGFAGPFVSAVIWAGAAAIYQWASPGWAMAALFVGGVLIFPLSTLVLKLLGGPASLPKGHPGISLGTQAALTVPLGVLVAIALGSYEPQLFFPASLIVVGAHYLLFIFLYGMRLWAFLAATLAAVGLGGLFWQPVLADLSGWIGAGVFLAFSVPLYLAGRDPRSVRTRSADAPTSSQ